LRLVVVAAAAAAAAVWRTRVASEQDSCYFLYVPKKRGFFVFSFFLSFFLGILFAKFMTWEVSTFRGEQQILGFREFFKQLLLLRS
jgi:hypothetical protein